MLELLVGTINVPAIVFSRLGDVLAANRPARAVWPGMPPGTNRLRYLFVDPVARSRHPDWMDYTADAVAHLRAQIGTDTEDTRLHALIGELSLKSERFRQLWARHDVRAARSGEFVIHHRRVGELRLLVQKFAVVGDSGLEALLLHARPGTAAEGLATLTALVDTDDPVPGDQGQ